jgi:hypothetical protein
MRAIDVSTNDGMVIDNEGSVWVYVVNAGWDYLTCETNTDRSGLTGWDYRADLPQSLEPYVRLDMPARRIIRRGL